MICARLTRAAALGAFVLYASTARADVAAAEALFREGRQLVMNGDYAGACAKFAESQRLDPSAGTLLNLGDCSERLGKIATAWTHFLSAARLADEQGKAPIAAEARSRAAVLEPRVSHLIIDTPRDVAGLHIVLDSQELAPSALAGAVPVDPGRHVIVASATGYVEWRGEVEITGDGQSLRVSEIRLEHVAEQKPPAPPAAIPVTEQRRRAVARADTPGADVGSPTPAYVAGAVAVAGLATGTVFGVLALKTYADAEDGCNGQHKNCSEEAMKQRSDVDTYALASNIGFGVGLVSLGAATYFFLNKSSRNEPRAAWRVLPALGPWRGGVRIDSSF